MKFPTIGFVVFTQAALAQALFAPSVHAQTGRTAFELPGGATHWYQAVTAPQGISWAEANRAAADAGGYLATIHSSQENDFVFSLVDRPELWELDPAHRRQAGPWIGGLLDEAAVQRAWRWAELQPFATTFWSAGEPRADVGSPRLHFVGSNTARKAEWAARCNEHACRGYVIEFSGPTSPRTVGLQIHDAAPSTDYTLFSPLQSRSTYLIDSRGRVAHQWTSPRLSAIIAYLLPNGHLLRAGWLDAQQVNYGGSTGSVEEFTWDGKRIWQFTHAGPDFTLHHDIEPLPDGHILMIAWEKRTYAEMIAAGFDPRQLPPDGLFWPDKIIEIKPTADPSGGTIVWEWHAWDHLVQDHDATKANYGVVVNHPERINTNFPEEGTPLGDWLHTNSIDYDPRNDHIMISSRTFSEIWVIDHSTTTKEAAGHTGGRSGKGGDLLYRWGNPQAYGAGTAKDQRLFGQHDAQWIEPGRPGAGNILVFNNGNGRDHSSVDEIVPPVIDAKGNYVRSGKRWGPDQPTWSYRSPERTDFFASFISGCERQPNGNTLIVDGPVGRLFEVDRQGRTVWQYVNPVGGAGVQAQGGLPVGNLVFRARRFARNHPAFAGRSLPAGEPLERYSGTLLADGSPVSMRVRRGSTVELSLGSSSPGLGYQLATSTTPGLIEHDHRFVRLGSDLLLYLSTSYAMPSVFRGYSGVFDSRGRAEASIAIPDLPLLAGLRLHTAFIVVDLDGPKLNRDFSNTVVLTIDP